MRRFFLVEWVRADAARLREHAAVAEGGRGECGVVRLDGGGVVLRGGGVRPTGCATSGRDSHDNACATVASCTSWPPDAHPFQGGAEAYSPTGTSEF